jgi:hypothetical protein
LSGPPNRRNAARRAFQSLSNGDQPANAAAAAAAAASSPSTASILFPLINVECSTQDLPPFHCTDAASCRKCSATTADGISPTSLHVTVDGNDVLNGAQGFRALSPFFNFTVPADNILG